MRAMKTVEYLLRPAESRGHAGVAGLPNAEKATQGILLICRSQKYTAGAGKSNVNQLLDNDPCEQRTERAMAVVRYKWCVC